MKVLKVFVTLLLVLMFSSCDNSDSKVEEKVNIKKDSIQVADIVKYSYDFYGVDKLLKSDISFKFRKHNYSLKRSGNGVTRSRVTIDSNNVEIKDVWEGDSIQRFISDSLQILDEKQEVAYRNSINSVFYFAFLPKGLTDPAVNLELLRDVKIKGKEYYKVRVTFDEEGGGEDFQDIFIYWFDKKDFSMDYLAYQYFTEGGGIRFREAMNIREIDGVTFQDYINYKPSSGTLKLEDTDQAFENNKLIEVSRIELENLEVD